MADNQRHAFLRTIAIAIAAIFILSSTAIAQTANRGEGIAGERDKKGRTPDLGVRVIHEADHVKIVADAHIPNKDYDHLPVRYDFFVERRLFSSQIRTPQLTGAVGIDVGADVATIPFNYTVVATVLSPNGRNFTTLIDGAVFDSILTTTLDCTLVLDANNDSESTEYVSNNVETTQLGNNTFEFSFEEESVGDENGDKANVAVSISVTTATNEASGLVTVIINENVSSTRTVSVSGTANFDTGGEIEGVTLNSEDGTTSLSCS
jgi:hypothetical protein